jgi:hypothetical protein
MTDTNAEPPAAGIPRSPDPAPTSGGWVAPDAGAPARPIGRGVRIAVWVAALLFVGLLAGVRASAAEGTTAFRAGVVVGAFAAPFLLALALRWLVVRLRRGQRGAPVGVVRSPWVPLGAIVVAFVGGLSTLATAAPTAPVDLATAARIGSGFTLRDADPTVAEGVAQALAEERGSAAHLVRTVIGDDGSVSVLLIADLGLREGDIEDAARDIAGASGQPPHVDTIAGQRVATATSEGIAVGAWVEAPLMLAVYAPDEATLRAVITSIIATPRSRPVSPTRSG